ncbi:MAG: ATP-binding cassette domain-containing protein [Chlamydiota bacterium]
MNLPFIQANKVSKEYRGGVYALKNVSLSIEKGEVFGIIGLSGAGKSTLIRILANLITPTSGKVFFSLEDISQFHKKELRSFRFKCGMIFQHFNLLTSRTVFGNVAYPLEIAGYPQEKIAARVDELLRLVGLSNKKHSYPIALSGGEKQRVGIARALAHHPEVLFCDEATSALDPKTTQEILTLLRDLNRNLGVTIVLITHEMDVIKQICHKVAVLENGTVVESGPVAEVFAEPKHPTTQKFLQNSAHEIPEHFYKPPNPTHMLLRLSFKGETAGKPIISQMIREFDVDANILLGWVDNLQTNIVGTLVIEIQGKEDNLQKALAFLHLNKIHCEVMKK